MILIFMIRVARKTNVSSLKRHFLQIIIKNLPWELRMVCFVGLIEHKRRATATCKILILQSWIKIKFYAGVIKRTPISYLQDASKPSKKTTCAVCLEVSNNHHTHYGALVCYSCRAFFRRANQVKTSFFTAHSFIQGRIWLWLKDPPLRFLWGKAWIYFVSVLFGA